MPDWLPAVIAVIIANIPTIWATIQRRRLESAEANKVDAEAVSALVQSYKLLVTDLTQQRDEARQGCDLREGEIRRLKEENTLLYEQKMSLMGHNQILTARLALVRDEDLTNNS